MDQLISEIEAFCKQFQMKETTFGGKTVSDGKFVERLRNGGECLPRTEKKVRNFMYERRKERELEEKFRAFLKTYKD